MDESGFDIVMKIVIVGDTSVGKTNLLLRYCKDTFVPDTKATIGIDFFTKDIIINGRSIKVQFWDTAGQEKYQSISHTYYKMVSGVLLVYDITRHDTFSKAEELLNDIHKYCTPEVKIMLIGNKLDMQAQREVKVESAIKFAKDNNLFFWETSALNNKENCVLKAIDALLSECLTNVQIDKSSSSLLEIKKKYVESVEPGIDLKKRGCC